MVLKIIHKNKGIYMVPHITIFCKTTKNLTHENFALYGIIIIMVPFVKEFFMDFVILNKGIYTVHMLSFMLKYWWLELNYMLFF